MVSYQVVFTKNALKDLANIKTAGLEKKVRNLIELLSANPFQNPPAYVKLVGSLSGAYSRRINIQHRLVYQIYKEQKIIKIISMWSHYDF
ncbi:MAG: Txe/YoeB family addiction module toxin, partial [Sphaerochaetaceae bacterium]|nr:Txe/YoeB family addiction module toxin [Sphaerochaetaceae bacterium]